MANLDELQKEHEARLDRFIQELARGGRESDLALARALIHRGVHLAIDRRAGEFCALTTFLCEMVGHAHGLMHGADPVSAKHDDLLH
jgi:muconolactone delta-isomerase